MFSAISNLSFTSRYNWLGSFVSSNSLALSFSVDFWVLSVSNKLSRFSFACSVSYLSSFFVTIKLSTNSIRAEIPTEIAATKIIPIAALAAAFIAVNAFVAATFNQVILVFVCIAIECFWLPGSQKVIKQVIRMYVLFL